VSQPLMMFKSHIEGKNADVVVYADRVEWSKEGSVSKGKLALGAATGGLSLLKTGVAGRQRGSEVIPIKSMSSVTTEKDGFRFTKVQVICSGNTIDFRVGHDEAAQIKELLTSLIIGNHPAQQVSNAPPAAPAPPDGPDVMEQIRKLGELKEAGLLSEEEFQAKKADLLDRL
jgi:hypothetical protein